MKNISRLALSLMRYTASEVAPHEGTRPTSSCRPGPLTRRRGLMTLSIALAAVNYLSGAAGDWPQWRGPNRDGVSTETGLLKDWPAGGPPLVWKAIGLGSGYATVSIAGNRIFTVGDKSDSSYLIALSLANGKSLWSAKVGR